MDYCLYEHVYERWLLSESEVYVGVDFFGRRGHGNEHEWINVIELNPGDLFIHTKPTTGAL